MKSSQKTFAIQSHAVILKCLEQIDTARAKAKSPKELFELIKKEQKVLANEYHNLRKNDHYKDNPLLATRVEAAHESSKQGYIQNLGKSFELVTSKKLLSNKHLLNTLRNTDESNIRQVHDDFVKVYQKEVAKEINRGLDLIAEGHPTELDGKHFTDELHLLQHVIDHHGHKSFFPTQKIVELHASIERELEEMDHHHTKVSSKGYGMEM